MFGWDWDDFQQETEPEEVPEKTPTPPSVEPSMSEWSSLRMITLDLKQNRSIDISDCGKFICSHFLPDSGAIGHPFQTYPISKDPGIHRALFGPDEPSDDDDGGKAIYLERCKQLHTAPIKQFYEHLKDECIDLRYYGIPPNNVLAMCHALENNESVRILNLMDNWLNRDACYHIGKMIQINIFLTDINLYGCRVGPVGIVHLCEGIKYNRSIVSVNIGKNKILDEGGKVLASHISRRFVKLNLSHNELTIKTVRNFNMAMEYYYTPVEVLDLSWNSFVGDKSVSTLFNRLAETHMLRELNLSWLSLGGSHTAKAIANLIASDCLTQLNLSNNSISTEDIMIFCKALPVSPSLIWLDLSDNPLTTTGPILLLKEIRKRSAKLKILRLDNVTVDQTFLKMLKHMKSITSKKDVTVTYGYVEKNYLMSSGPDFRLLVLKRMEYLMRKQKKKKRRLDLALLLLEVIYKNPKPFQFEELHMILRKKHIRLEKGILESLADAFPGPIINKEKSINPKTLSEYIHRMWPNAKYNPPPPAEKLSVEEVPKEVEPPKRSRKLKEKTKGSQKFSPASNRMRVKTEKK